MHMENLRHRTHDAGLPRAVARHRNPLLASVQSRRSRFHGRVLASSTATLDEKPVAAEQPGAVISPLVGKKVLQLGPQLSAVPLLHPIAHNLPFAASLQIYSDSSSRDGGAAAVSSTMPSSSSQHSPSSSLVELHYVISGNGHFVNSASGVQQALWPGDSIISLHGAATFAAGPAPNQVAKQQQDITMLRQETSPAWPQLLGWLQQLHNKQQRSTHHQQQQPQATASATAVSEAIAQHSSSNQLVMLQLLLPSELLTGEMQTHHAGHCHAVAEQLPWQAGSAQESCGAVSLHGLAPAGSIHEAEVCGLLVDGGLSSPESRSVQQSMQEESHQGQQDQARRQQEAHAEIGASSADDSDSSGHSSSVSAHVLPGLDQQQISKRALSDVGAFRLPKQTNRLALLFGPHCSPAVCCSFGVEQFEPGHVTPLHIHNTAHELFFVLAGKGEAVFSTPGMAGAGSHADSNSGTAQDKAQPQRVTVSPGDVAVFPPGVVHGVDNPSDSQLYCLQMMLPNEAFVEFVRSGEEVGKLDVSAVQRIAAAASCG